MFVSFTSHIEKMHAETSVAIAAKATNEMKSRQNMSVSYRDVIMASNRMTWRAETLSNRGTSPQLDKVHQSLTLLVRLSNAAEFFQSICPARGNNSLARHQSDPEIQEQHKHNQHESRRPGLPVPVFVWTTSHS